MILYKKIILIFGFVLFYCTNISIGQDSKNSLNGTKKNHGNTITKEGYIDFEKRNEMRKSVIDSADLLIGSFFKSSKYRFSVNLIKDWKTKRGDKELPVVVQCYQQDSMKKMGVIVNDYPNLKLDEGVTAHTQFEKLEKIIEQILSNKDINIKKHSFNRTKLSGVPAILLKYYFIQKNGDSEIDVFCFQYLCIKRGKLFNITFSMPGIFYSDNEVIRINKIVESFKFY